MKEIMILCNDNEGFLSVLLSAMGLLISIISVFVSIRTARLPYKKKLELSVDSAFAITDVDDTGMEINSFIGITITATNVGFRDINLEYLGICILARPWNIYGYKTVKKPLADITGKGVLKPSEVRTEIYTREALRYNLLDLDSKMKLALYAKDTEGKEYRKSFVRISTLIEIAELNREEIPRFIVDKTWV